MNLATKNNFEIRKIRLQFTCCDTTVQVCGMPQCAEIHYRTRTLTTRFGKPAGFPVPVPNPRDLELYPLYDAFLPSKQMHLLQL